MMSKISELILISGLDIELDKLSVKIRQPKIKEIALMGEDKFFNSMSIFYIKPEPLMNLINLSEEEKKIWIDSSTAYDNLLSLIQAAAALGSAEDRNVIINWARLAFETMVPTHTFVFNDESETMILMADNESHSIVVDRDLFSRFKDIAEEIFLLDKFFGISDSTAKLSAAAQKIADKMALSEQKLKKLKNENDEENSQFARIISIMGMNYELDYLSNLTVYQLYNQFERFNLFSNYTQGTQALLAGASNVEIVDWYKKI